MRKNRTVYGFKTADLEILPYLHKTQVWEDATDGIIPGVYRRSQSLQCHHIIPAEEVIPYWQSKGIPENLIRMKGTEIGLFSTLAELNYYKSIMNFSSEASLPPKHQAPSSEVYQAKLSLVSGL